MADLLCHTGVAVTPNRRCTIPATVVAEYWRHHQVELALRQPQVRHCYLEVPCLYLCDLYSDQMR